MKITWQIEYDHHSVKSRPYCMDIDDEDLAELHSVEAKNEFIEECVQDEFERVVTFSWKRV